MTSLSSLLSPSSESGSAMKRAPYLLPILALATVGCAAEATIPDTSTDRVMESSTVAPAKPMSGKDLTGMAISNVAADEGIQISPSMASDYADIVCEGLDDGLHPLIVASIGAEEIPRYSSEDHGFLVGASIGANCPEHLSLLGGDI